MHRRLCRLAGLAIGIAIQVFGEDLKSTKQLEGILQELQKIRALLERFQSGGESARASSIVAMDLDGEPLGSPEAPITIVEFADYQCPYCKDFFRRTFTDIKKTYIDSKRVRYFVIDLPSPSHPHALRAAQAVRCAGEQGRYWAMREALLAADEGVDSEGLTSIGQRLNVDVEELRQCVESGRYKEAIQQDVKTAATKGIRGTPTFVVGKSIQGGVEGEVVVGSVPFGIIEKKLKQLENK